jgi:hypothetical protein
LAAAWKLSSFQFPALVRLTGLFLTERRWGRGEDGPETVRGVRDILDPKTDSITVSFLDPRFEGFVDLSTVDTTSVLSKVSLAGPIEEARSRFPHEVGQSRDDSRRSRESRQDEGKIEFTRKG